MALWDPVAAGNAAIYLRLPDTDLLEIRNAPFDGRTAVWVPYAETGYTKGKKTGEAGGKVQVERLIDGKAKAGFRGLSRHLPRLWRAYFLKEIRVTQIKGI